MKKTATVLAVLLVIGILSATIPRIGDAQKTDGDSVQITAMQQTEKARAEAEKARIEAEKVKDALELIGKWPLVGFGFLFGYFFFYGIRHGRETAETFKAFLGILGVGGTATVLSLVGNDPRIMVRLLRPFAEGCFFGFGFYFFLAIGLAAIGACGEKCLSKMAHYLSRALLGEDWTDKQGSRSSG